MTAVVTYAPGWKTFIVGEHKRITNDLGRIPKHVVDTRLIPPYTFYDARCDDAHKNLIQTYCKLYAIRTKFAPLDSMFAPLLIDELYHTHDFMHPATPPVIRSHEPDKFEHKYSRIPFDLQNTMNSYAVPHDLSANKYFEALPKDISCALNTRAECALTALEQLPSYYIKDASDDAAKFQTTATESNAQRIRHSRAEALTEIEDCRSAFERAFGLRLTRFACSLNTAITIAGNMMPEPTFFEKACRNGGVCPFPGMPNATMAISTECPDDVLYAVSGVSRSLLQAEGPKIIKQNQSGTCTVLDYYQYKCVHEDATTDHPFGYKIDLTS